MLLKMLPDAVSAIWPEAKYQIAAALPTEEQTEKALSNLLGMLLTGKASCWVSYDAEDNNKVNFVLLLIPFVNSLSGEKVLNLYSLTRVASMDLKTSNRMWFEGFAAIQKYMKKHGFSKLVGYFEDSNNRSLKMVKRLGAKVKYCIEINVEV